MKNTLLAVIAVCPCLFGQTPVIQGVVNSASYQTTLAPGTWTAIFGSQLSGQTTVAAATPFPAQLGGVSVTVGGKAAPLSFVSPGQVNALIPFETPTGAASVVVTTSGGVSAAFSVTLQRNAPAFYTKDASGKGAALAFDANFGQVKTIDGSPVVLYATGLGPTTPDAVTGEVTGSATLKRLQDAMVVTVGGTPATVLFAGLAPGLHGVYQVNITPKGPFLGDTLSAVVAPFGFAYASSPLTLPVPQGVNVANVTGSIDGLYPATGAVAADNGGKPTTGLVTMSALLTAATFTTTFDIVPGAPVFQVVALAGNYRTTFTVDPVNRTWTSTGAVPTAAERVYDFSARVGSAVYDFQSASQFAGNVVPRSRLDPLAVRAIAALPLANAADGSYQTSGSIAASGRLTLTGNFGGFTIYNRTFATKFVTVPFALYIDSKLVASTSATINFD